MKKKLILAGVVVAALFTVYEWARFEACKQKYPGTSGWVCLFFPK